MMIRGGGGDVAGNKRGGLQGEGDVDVVQAGGSEDPGVSGESGCGRVKDTKRINEIVIVDIISQKRDNTISKTIIF